MTRITIITPSFNQGHFLEETILSVLNQNYANLEYIIIDGGSSDDSVEIIRKYEKYLSHWVSEADSGQTHAINKGLARATGDVIAYLNSDDLYLPGTLDRVAKVFGENPGSDLFYGRCRYIDSHGQTLGGRTGAISDYAEMVDLWDVWWRERNFVQPEVFWTKRISDRIGPFREDLFYVMDYDYWARIFRANGKAHFIDEELACFRIHPDQKSTRPEETAAELLSVVRPLIWEKHPAISSRVRLELKGKWLYSTKFLPEIARSVREAEPRLKRHLRVFALALREPYLFACKAFRKRIMASLVIS